MTKPLKEQNRWQIWLIVAVNTVFLCALVQVDAIQAVNFRTIFESTESFLSPALAIIVSTALNGLLSADNKARLVFLRWRYALPGHRAFTQYGKFDPRIDLDKLTEAQGIMVPTDPTEQNQLWYRLYKTVENSPAVLQTHRDFLLMRDYTGLAALFVPFLGAIGFYAIASITTSCVYSLCLLGQYLVVRQAAAHYGIRMVATVLAQKMIHP